MKLFAVTLIVALAAVVSGGPAHPVLKDLDVNNIIIGDQLYFSDTSTTLRSRADALLYCKSQDAELAKVTNKSLFDTLRLAISVQGTYWVDGIDKNTHERFELNNNCTSGEMDFSGLLPVNLVLTPKQCLALVKGTTASNSRIQATDCIIPNRVLCSYPLNGCAVPTTPSPLTPPPTTMASGDSVL